jgi:hypothetical protein
MNKTLDTYLSLCMEVYDLNKPNLPEEHLAFCCDYVMKTNGSILEPMRGTGFASIALRKSNIHYFDVGDHILKVLYAKAKAKHL